MGRQGNKASLVGYRVWSSFLSFGSLGGFGIVVWAGRIAERIKNDGITDFALQWPNLFPLTIASLGLLWLLRLTAKLFLSNAHLASDAAQRRVLIQTWQAMHASGELPKDADRSIMLTNIFTHGTMGLVADDAAPQMPWAKLVEVSPVRQ